MMEIYNSERFRNVDQLDPKAFGNVGLSEKVWGISEAAVRGGRELLRYFDAPADVLRAQFKEEDATPYTVADTEAERLINDFLLSQYPTDRLFGEEFGFKGNPDSSTTTWVDPCDGSNAYIRKQRTSTVGIAVTESDRLTQAAICLPHSRELVVAERGKGAFLYQLDDDLNLTNQDATKLAVSDRRDLNRSVVYMDGNRYPANKSRKLRFEQMMDYLVENGNFRYFMPGTNIGQQAEVAMGKGDLNLTDCVGCPPDILPGALAIIEAGGVSTDQYGNETSPAHRFALQGNPYLHKLTFLSTQRCYDGFESFTGKKYEWL